MQAYLKEMGMTSIFDWRLPVGHREAYLREMGMAGLASAWVMAR